MNRTVLRLLAFGALAVAAGCNTTQEPFSTRVDVIRPVGTNSSVYLHSSADGTDMVFFGSTDPLAVVPSSAARPFLAGKVLTDGSTTVHYGTYELDATGHGAFHLSSTFEFANESSLYFVARSGATRTDYPVPYHFPIIVTQSAAGLGVEVDYSFGTSTHTYTGLDVVMAAIDTSGATAYEDVFQLHNFAMSLANARVPALGGGGFTRYITTPGQFTGLVDGSMSVALASLTAPNMTLSYTAFEDLRGIYVDGAITEDVNISFSGSMQGVVRYEFRHLGDPLDVVVSGTVDYGGITLQEGYPASGDYVVTIDGIPGTGTVSYAAATNVDLTNLLPVTP